MNTEEFITYMKEWVAYAGRSVKPNGDWLPVSFFANMKGVSAVPVPTALFADGKSKDVLATMLAGGAITEQAAIVGLVVMQWTLEKRVTDPAEWARLRATPLRSLPGIKDHPGRKEVVALMVFDRNGERIIHAPVTRAKGKRPQLGAWFELPMARVGESRFAEQIVPAMARNN